MHASADFFRLCGANAVQGRTFTAADDLPDAPKTVVLAYAFWRRHFGGDTHVIGRRITLSGARYEIIGVVSPSLQDGQIAERSRLSGDIEIHEPPDVYVPFQLDPNSASHGHHFNVAGRLKPGVTLAEANAQLQASYREYGRKWPDDVRGEGAGFRVQPLQDAIVDGVRNSLLILLGAVAFVLAAIGWTYRKTDLIAIGLALWSLSILISRLSHLSLGTILLLVAFLAFVAAAVGWRYRKVNLIAIGLAAWTLTYLVA